MLFCEFCNYKCVDPNSVIQILLDSQGSLEFKKNMIWAHDVEILDELNMKLKCVFKCMQTYLNYILVLVLQKLWNFVGELSLLSRSSGKNLWVIACMVLEL